MTKLNSEGVRKFQPRVVSTLGKNQNQETNAAGVGDAASIRQRFQRLRVKEIPIPGLKQPWAGIRERLRRTCLDAAADFAGADNNVAGRADKVAGGADKVAGG